MSFPSELRQAIRDCRERGLLVASKWAAECLAAIPVEARMPPPAGLDALLPNGFGPASATGGMPLPFHTSTPSRPVASSSTVGGGAHPLQANHLRSPDFHRGRPSLSTMSPSDFVPQSPALGLLDSPHPLGGGSSSGSFAGLPLTEADVEDADTFDLARAYFETRELDRCAWTLTSCTGVKAAFLRAYARYLSIDKRMQESLGDVMSGQDDRHQLGASLQPLLTELKNASDPFLLYLKGTILLRLRRRPEAATVFIKSIGGYACNWSAYVGLTACVSSSDELETILSVLPPHPFTTCFEIHARLDFHIEAKDVGELVDELERSVFSIGLTERGRREGRTWIWGASRKALIDYHVREDFGTAEASFDAVQRLDPYRLDDIDDYSNMLFIFPKFTKLAQLAKEYSNIDRHRPETCTLIGNFYASREEHAKAIQYFRRAVLLNRDYSPAWTLMGHEYIEMQNSHAAIEAYRRAVDSNPRDFRAWYGLGQTYELLDMPQYAIQYYNKATALRPADARMWQALGQVYENTDRRAEALQVYERALHAPENGGDSPLAILHRLAMLAQALGRFLEAARWTEAMLGEAQRTGRPEAEMAQGWLFLARYEVGAFDGHAGEGEREQQGGVGRRREPNWALAAHYLQTIVRQNVPERDEALALQVELDARQAQADAEVEESVSA